MLTFEVYEKNALLMIKNIQEEPKKEMRTEFLCLLIKHVIKGCETFSFSFPAFRNNFFSLVLESNVTLKKEYKQVPTKTLKKVNALSLYTQFALLAINEPTENEEKALFLIEKILLLYNNKILSPVLVKALFDSVNEENFAIINN